MPKSHQSYNWTLRSYHCLLLLLSVRGSMNCNRIGLLRLIYSRVNYFTVMLSSVLEKRGALVSHYGNEQILIRERCRGMLWEIVKLQYNTMAWSMRITPKGLRPEDSETQSWCTWLVPVNVPSLHLESWSGFPISRRGPPGTPSHRVEVVDHRCESPESPSLDKFKDYTCIVL